MFLYNYQNVPVNYLLYHYIRRFCMIYLYVIYFTYVNSKLSKVFKYDLFIVFIKCYFCIFRNCSCSFTRYIWIVISHKLHFGIVVSILIWLFVLQFVCARAFVSNQLFGKSYLVRKKKVSATSKALQPVFL